MSQPSQLQQPSARYVLPVIEERTSYGFKRLDPYTKLFEERIIFLGQAIDDTVANDIMAQLLTLESMDPDRDISIYVNSPGGSFTALTAIYDTMQYVKPDITTICFGQAASAAAVLLAAGTPGKRLALPHGRVLLHQPYLGGGGGQATDIEILAREVLRMKDMLEDLLALHTGQPKERISRDTDRDFVMSAEEAKAYGIIDEVIAVRQLAPAGAAATA